MPLLDLDAGVFRKGGRHRLEVGWCQGCVRCARGIHGEDSGSELLESSWLAPTRWQRTNSVGWRSQLPVDGSWRASSSMTTDFVLDALEQTLYTRQPERDRSLVIHSDRGMQYVSIRYSERLAEAGVEPSVGSNGDSYDHALAQTINDLHKSELNHRRVPWKTKESLELATLEWVSWFNHHRLLESIGYIPPAEAEANNYRHLAAQVVIAV